MPPRPSPASSRSATTIATSTRFSALKTLGWVGVALAGALYLGFVRRHCAYLATDSDTSGYLNIAQRLMNGHLVQPVPDLAGLHPPMWDYVFQRPLGFLIDPLRGTMVTTYPVGFPLHLVAAAPFVGLDYATIVVNVCLVAASGMLMFALGRKLRLPRPWALAGVALLWCCPLFILYELQPMSELPATVWTMAAIWTALRARDRWPWGFVTGLAVSMAVLVRPTDLLVLLPVALAIGLRRRAWLALIAGGLPAAGFLAWYNLTLYGAVLTTGYGYVGELFGLRFLPHNVLHFAYWIPVLLSPFVALPALALPTLRRKARQATVVMVTWTVVLTVFYLFYYHAGETWWYLRFILPIFPFVILAGLAVIRHWHEHGPSFARLTWFPVVLFALAFAWELKTTGHFEPVTLKHGNLRYLHAIEWMNTHAPANAIVVQMQMSGSFTYYTHFAMARWDMMTPEAWATLQAAARAAHRPIYATLFDFERAMTEWKNLGGHWQLEDRYADTTIWRLMDPAGLPPTASSAAEARP